MNKLDDFSEFKWRVFIPFSFSLYLFFNIPSAYFSGVRLIALTNNECWVTIRKKWFNRNPFKSIYFASLAMAAEMSTGVLVMAHSFRRSPKISMLVTDVDATYMKKSVGKILFKCGDGVHVVDAINRATKYGKTVKLQIHAFGYNKAEEMVASFTITWSLKAEQA